VAEQATAVIGRQADTAVAKNWPGHEVLDLPANEWTLAKNDQRVQGVIDRKMPVYVGSNPTWPNLWDAVAGRPTVSPVSRGSSRTPAIRGTAGHWYHLEVADGCPVRPW
jgi:hypothetical protein